MIKITYCRNFAEAETREVDWDTFARSLSKYQVFASKDASARRAAFIGGIRADEDKGRADGNIVLRTVATVDYDALDCSVEDVEFSLTMRLDCAFVAYSTFRHTPERPRVRVCVPLSRGVTEAEHRVVVEWIISTLALGAADNCSYRMCQLMFLPSRQEGIDPFTLRQDGEPLDVDAAAIGLMGGARVGATINPIVVSDRGSDDLLVAVAAQPLDISDDEVVGLLENYPAEGKDYDEWLAVGMALWHQYIGAASAYTLWRDWSALCVKHDERHMRVKWASFTGSARPKTLASIIAAAGGRRGGAVEVKVGGGGFAALRAEAEGLLTLDDYGRFRNRIRALDDARLPPDTRSMLAHLAHEVYARAAGMGLRDVKSAFRYAYGGGNGRASGGGLRQGDDPDSGGGGGLSDSDPAPRAEWLKGWVYNESMCTFERVDVRHGIKREAFRAKYDREPECVSWDTDSATLALVKTGIPTVAGLMYWPGQERLFETEGLLRLNSYFWSGVTPAETLQGDEDAAEVIARFMTHVGNTIADPREQRILVDWMAFVYQNPGRRVKWALLLQGIEGNGKSYFFNVMQLLLGERARVVSSGAIDSPFTGWAEGSVLVGIEEIRISGTNKYSILDRMKPLLTNDVIPVVHKGVNERHVPNFTSYMMFTNHADAIPVGENDRRYCAIFTRQTRLSDLFDQHGGREGAAEYFRVLFSGSERRADALARFLQDWPISEGFDASTRAPDTAGLHRMRSLNVSDDKDAVEAAIESHACGVVGPDLIDATWLTSVVTMDGGSMPAGRTLAHILTDMGYQQIEQRRIWVKRKTKHHYLWFRGGVHTDDTAKARVMEFHDSARDNDFLDPPF